MPPVFSSAGSFSIPHKMGFRLLLIQLMHQLQRVIVNSNRAIVQARPIDPQQITLVSEAEC